MQSQLCLNPVIVSVEELQKVVAEITKEKVNTQEPPSQPLLATTDQPKEKEAHEKIAMVDSSVIVTTTAEKPTKEKIGQDVTTTQSEGAPPQIIIIEIRQYFRQKKL